MHKIRRPISTWYEQTCSPSNNRKENLELDPRRQSKTIPQSSSHSQQIEMNAHRVIMRKRLVLDPHLLAHFWIIGFLAIFRLCYSISA